MAQQISMPYVWLEREGFCQQYKKSDVLSILSKERLQKIPTLRRCAAAPHNEGELSSVYIATKFISIADRKRLFQKWLVS